MGGVADRIKWVGGVSDEAVKKAESAGEWVKIDSRPDRGKAGTSSSKQTGMMSRNDEQEGRQERTDGPATCPFIDPVVWDGGNDPKRCVVT